MGRYRLSPHGVEAWRPFGFGANAAYTCTSLGLTSADAVTADEKRRVTGARCRAEEWRGSRHERPVIRLDGALATRDVPPDALLSWNDDYDDGPKTQRRQA